MSCLNHEPFIGGSSWHARVNRHGATSRLESQFHSRTHSLARIALYKAVRVAICSREAHDIFGAGALPS